MNNLSDLLEKANVRKALIVDDAYDQVPLPSDLSAEADEWAQFFDDLTDEDVEMIRAIYPRYDGARADELRASEEFIAAVWRHRNDFREALVSPLFARYESGTATDLGYLATLESRLSVLGLACTKAGRDFHGEAGGVDLVIIDLFLGSTQGEADSTLSIDGLRKVIAARRGRPPLVILMSRNPRIHDKREEFRDSVGLFESAFRILQKAELADSGKLQRLLNRLASHYADSLKLAGFLRAWNDGLTEARERTSRLIRTLDLADYAQIRQLLLSAEGEPTGGYLVDVFDRVLQHEVEGNASIIDAAIKLNTLTSETYPPPYVAGSRDLQSLVYRSLFQHPERLRLVSPEANPVAFGDLLRRKVPPDGVGAPTNLSTTSLLGDISTTDVLAVLSPACDLQRQGAKRILLLVGTLSPLQPAGWTYKEDRTPIIELSEGQRWWIKWNLKHIETLSRDELTRVLEAANGFEIVARIRESHALEIQQKLLSNLGRVGQIAPMPATFPMRVELYLRDKNKVQVPIEIPALSREGGVCYVGRNEEGGRLDRLILCEAVCEEICEAIEKVDLSPLHDNTKATVTFLRTNGEQLAQALERGIWLPNGQGQKDILLSSGVSQEGDSTLKPRSVGCVIRDREVLDGDLKKSGLVLAAWEEPVGQKEASRNVEPPSSVNG